MAQIVNFKKPDENIDSMNSESQATRVSSSSVNDYENSAITSAIQSMSEKFSLKSDFTNYGIKQTNEQLRSINKYSEDSSIWLSEIYNLLNSSEKRKNIEKSVSGSPNDAQKLKPDNAIGGGGAGNLVGGALGGALGAAALRGIGAAALRLVGTAAAIVATPEVLIGAAIAATIATVGYGAYKTFIEDPGGGSTQDRFAGNPGAKDANKSLIMDLQYRAAERQRTREFSGSSDANPENRDRQGFDLKSMEWADEVSTTSTSPDAMKVSSNGEGGRSGAESYLGRKMSDEEYDYLVRATHAEAAAGKNADPKEQAMIMASILNRARDMGENGVIEALTAKNQFQSVTGTSANDNAPSVNFTQGPAEDRKSSIESSAAMLGGISRDQKNFTAASSGAYGAGTNIGYRDDMIASGGTQIGGSVFNTAGPQDMGTYSPVSPDQQKSAGGEDDKDAAGGLTSIRTASGKTAQVGAAYASNLQGFISDLEATGYQINSLGGYANRANVNNPSVKSYHAMGAAIDINPEQNPNNSTKTDLPPETGALAAKWGLGWGMNWKSVKDPMHFSAAKSEQGSFDIKRASIGPGEVQGGAATGGGGKSDATASAKGGGGSAPAPAAVSKPSGGIASSIGSIGKLAGNLIGDLSKSTTMKSALPAVAPAAAGGSSAALYSSGGASKLGPAKLPTGGSSNPLPAIDNMFAKLFDESAMFA